MRPLQDIEQLPANTDLDRFEDITDLTIEALENTEGEELARDTDMKKEKPMKPHIIRRNVENYLEQKALERSLQDVFDSDYRLDEW